MLFAALLLAAGATSSRADYRGPDENTSEAFGPLQGAYTYSATLNQNGTNPDDQDWYYYYIPTAGDHLHWTVSNTNASTACPPYQCNVYATLEGSNGQQLGGSNSSAGTSGVGPGQTQTVDWTFPSPGKYYIAFIGDGPKISYTFSVTPADGVSSTPPGSGKTTTAALNLRARQSRRFVDFSLTAPAGGGKLAALLYLGRSLASSLHRAHIAAGRDHFALRLSARTWAQLARRHRLHATLRVTLTRPSASRLHASRSLTLRR
jgi:hypothetical protein